MRILLVSAIVLASVACSAGAPLAPSAPQQQPAPAPAIVCQPGTHPATVLTGTCPACKAVIVCALDVMTP